jgi:ABC-type lipoprotein export system ATPase subunit
MTCRQISFRRPDGNLILDRLDAEFKEARIALITGPTGAGKSTLLNLLAGLLRPTSGTISADGQPVSRWRAAHRDQWRRQTGILFQHLHLIPEFSVADNVLLPLVPRNDSREASLARAEPLMDRLGLIDMAQMPLRRLSGGQKQRTALARALIHQPRYLFLDEPTAFQDDDWVQTIMTMLERAARKDACVVVCSHDQRLVNAIRPVFPLLRLEEGHLEPAA